MGLDLYVIGTLSEDFQRLYYDVMEFIGFYFNIQSKAQSIYINF